MPVYNWKCKKCGKKQRALLASRPKLPKCECGGSQTFATQTTARVIEVRDTGLQIRRVEQLSGIEEMRAERAQSLK
jgi:predicted nucleic acid-binding Zn ribbon protein